MPQFEDLTFKGPIENKKPETGLNDNLKKIDGKFNLLPEERAAREGGLIKKGRTPERAEFLVDMSIEEVNEKIRSKRGRASEGTDQQLAA